MWINMTMQTRWTSPSSLWSPTHPTPIFGKEVRSKADVLTTSPPRLLGFNNKIIFLALKQNKLSAQHLTNTQTFKVFLTITLPLIPPPPQVMFSYHAFTLSLLIINIFFSSRSRFLRNRDRALHLYNYPKLFYPELYLIEGGYKAFFSKCKVTNIVNLSLKYTYLLWLVSRLLEIEVCPS